ncbi:hypothetical protein GPL21_30990 [Bradyrhizobium pachyrhizi]|uniref:Uncharacterized protein n=1 Tax=Bradyrhizobium pachyrhizi TaxID=280333 RepID=A0A844SU60_9BRAD|nr:hypothetical protein [Bradyrhizobium pachyrhizi]MVT69516.1 hypothetical protein [Bradyrhizobium pachyrhizi]
MRIDRTTITRHIGDETLTCRIKGKGRIKRRRVFTRFDVEAFLQALAETAAQCRLTDRKSSYHQFELSINRYRRSGSTKLRDERDAQAFEDARRAEAQALLNRLNREGRGPLRLKPAYDRWWNELGQHLADKKIKSVLDRIVEILERRSTSMKLRTTSSRG